MKKFFAALVLCSLLANSSLADLMYTFRFQPVAANVFPNVASSADIYLDETSTDTLVFPLRLNNPNFGLVTGKVKMSLNTAPGSFNLATPAFIDDGVFTISSGSVSGATASIAQTTFANPLSPFSLGLASGNTASIKLGSVDFTITGGLSGTITTDPVLLGELVLGDFAGTDLSTIGVSSGTLNFTVVPEPSSVIYVATLGLGWAWYGRRRRASQC